MPTPEQILEGLQRIAAQWKPLAVAWHAYFGILLILLLAGRRPGRRITSLLLVLPLLSVSAMAWIAGNPFNGTMFAVFGIGLGVIGLRLPEGEVRIAARHMLPAVLIIAFGWAYPHFMSGDGVLHYALTAPLGLVPCPTLSMVIGISLLLGGLGSVSWMRVLSVAGILYGVFGALRLGVYVDLILLVAALLLYLASTRMMGPASLHPGKI